MSLVETVTFVHIADIFTDDLQLKLFEHVCAGQRWRTNGIFQSLSDHH